MHALPTSSRNRRSIALAALAVSITSACAPHDARTALISQAEARIRARLNDPRAAFTAVRFTGDPARGQTCGFVKPARGTAVRFIVHADPSAGLSMEDAEGRDPVSEDRFEQAWQYDCMNPGDTAR